MARSSGRGGQLPGDAGIDATAYRVIHGEADRLPGLVVDRYGGYLGSRRSQGIDRLLPDLIPLLVDRLKPAGILARNDPRVRLLEGLEQIVRWCTERCPTSSKSARAGRIPGRSISWSENRFVPRPA